jgi:hypothetical protein
MNWKPCSDPPERDGFYEVQCLFPDGEPLTEPEILKWEGRWVGSFGLEVMPYDRYREIGGGE